MSINLILGAITLVIVFVYLLAVLARPERYARSTARSGSIPRPIRPVSVMRLR
ncbi:MAG: hypothetical protein NVSMB69_12970 [Novosphingobium sp.]